MALNTKLTSLAIILYTGGLKYLFRIDIDVSKYCYVTFMLVVFVNWFILIAKNNETNLNCVVFYLLVLYFTMACLKTHQN